MSQLAPNFIRIDNADDVSKLSVWTSSDYVGNYPYTLYSPSGVAIQKGKVKAKGNPIEFPEHASAGQYVIQIGRRRFPITKK